MQTGKREKITSYGLSLIELLVVIVVITLLISVTMPGLMVAKERGRRVVCLSNIHQLILGIRVYADHNNSRLPVTGIASTFEVSPLNYEILANHVGSDKVMFCPSLGAPFIRKSTVASWHTSYDNDLTYIGYNYLGGHSTTPWALISPATKPWESAQRSTCKITLPLITELNIWSAAYDKTVAPHGKKGACRLGNDYMNTGQGGITSGQIGAAGGNIGFMDGSGYWKKNDEENIYRVSNDRDDQGWFSTW